MPYVQNPKRPPGLKLRNAFAFAFAFAFALSGAAWALPEASLVLLYVWLYDVCVCVCVSACCVCVLGNVAGLCGFKLPDFVPSSGSGFCSGNGNGHQTEARELFNSNKYWKLNFLWCFLVGLLRFCGVLISNNLASSVSTPQSRHASVCVCVCWAYTNTVTHTHTHIHTLHIARLVLRQDELVKTQFVHT